VQPILLIDRDPFYVSRLAERLAQLLDGPVLAKPDSHPRLALEIEVLAESGIVIVANPELSTILRQGGLDNPTIVWLPWQESYSGQTKEADTLYRLMPASQMALVLKKQLAATATCPEDTLPQIAAKPPLINLTVALDLGWEGHRAFVQNWLSQQVQAGREVFYLPLMPNYLMKLVQTPRSGPNLTHLLLRLANGDALSPGELGVYLELHARGYWQFRPAERSDDLMQADATWLRSLVVLVREKSVCWQVMAHRIQTRAFQLSLSTAKVCPSAASHPWRSWRISWRSIWDLNQTGPAPVPSGSWVN